MAFISRVSCASVLAVRLFGLDLAENCGRSEPGVHGHDGQLAVMDGAASRRHRLGRVHRNGGPVNEAGPWQQPWRGMAQRTR